MDTTTPAPEADTQAAPPADPYSEARAMLRAMLDDQALGHATDADGDSRLREETENELHGLRLRILDRPTLATMLLTGYAVGCLPEKPADIWMSLISGRAEEWIDRADPAETLAHRVVQDAGGEVVA